jgi:hypothetical protein
MNCQSPVAPALDTALGWKPLSMNATAMRSGGRLFSRKEDRMMSRYLPLRLSHATNIFRPAADSVKKRTYFSRRAFGVMGNVGMRNCSQ